MSGTARSALDNDVTFCLPNKGRARFGSPPYQWRGFDAVVHGVLLPSGSGDTTRRRLHGATASFSPTERLQRPSGS